MKARHRSYSFEIFQLTYFVKKTKRRYFDHRSYIHLTFRGHTTQERLERSFITCHPHPTRRLERSSHEVYLLLTLLTNTCAFRRPSFFSAFAPYSVQCAHPHFTLAAPTIPRLGLLSSGKRGREEKEKKNTAPVQNSYIPQLYIGYERERETNSCEVRFSTGGDGFHFVVIFFPHLHRFSRSNALSGFDRSRPLHQKVKVACSVLLIA